MISLENCWMSRKQCRPWTDAAEGGVCSGSTMFAQACISKYLEIDHEIFSTVIHSIPLIQEGQLSVSGEGMCTITV